MDMTISMVKPASVNTLVEAALNGARVTPAAAPMPVLTGEAVTVQEPASSTTTDIEKLAAQLLQESNKAREESLLSHLKSLSENDVFEKLLANVNEEAKAAFTQMETKADELAQVESELEKAKENTGNAQRDLADAQENLDQAGRALTDAQGTKNAAEARLQALENIPDASPEDIDAAKQELSDAERALSAAQNDKTRAQDALDRAGTAFNAAAENEAALEARVIALENEIVELAEGLDIESYRLLSDALKAIEIHPHHIDSLEDPRAEKERKDGGTVPLQERSPLEIIRDSLRRQTGDILDSQETRRENIV